MVKAVKRTSLSRSGVWEVESIAESPSQDNVKRVKIDNSFKVEKGNKTSSPAKIENSSNKQDINKSPKLEVKKDSQANSISPKKDSQSPNKQRPNGLKNQNKNKKVQKDIHQGNDSTGNDKLRSWPSIDFLTLVSRIEENANKSKNILEMEYAKGLEMIDWAKVSFGGHTPEECKEIWELMFKRAWTNREIVEAIREMLMQVEIKAEKTKQSNAGHNAESSNKGDKPQQKGVVSHQNDDDSDEDDEEDDDDDDNDEDDDDEEEEDTE